VIDTCLKLIDRREPSYLITANLNYAMVSAEANLGQINAEAALVTADGMPLVWASWLQKDKLPERLTGADLVVNLCAEGANRGYGIYILGGPPGQAEQAGKLLTDRFPGLTLAGCDCPPFRAWTPEEKATMLQKIRDARPEILFVAFGQPKGEQWIHAHYRELNVPLSIQIGGSFDFVTGRLKRAPKWMQKTGLEWIYRFLQEPRRLGTRYAKNLYFIWRVTLGTLFSRRNRMLVSANLGSATSI
jgi:N-acetylglucosaminyldiphosphoundecaprenol N-acetyl-beta-D-mannosaminyltransferase